MGWRDPLATTKANEDEGRTPLTLGQERQGHRAVADAKTCST
jgi:hypothetical protein